MCSSDLTYNQYNPPAPQPLTPQQMEDRDLAEYRRTQNQGLRDFSQDAVAPGTNGTGIPSYEEQAVAPGTNGAGIPPDVLARYSAQTAGQQQYQPFSTQQFANNIQQGAGALGQQGLGQLGVANPAALQQLGQLGDRKSTR